MRGYKSTPEDFLFHKGDWHATQDAWRNKLVSAIEGKNGDELLNTSTADLAAYYVSEFEFEVPVVYPDDIVADQREVQIDVSHDHNRYIRDRSQPFNITGTSVDIELPYTGNKVGFDIQPSTQNFNNPRAYVDSDVLKFSVTGTDLTADRVKQEVDRRVASINGYP